jgi:hypothetical protein
MEHTSAVVRLLAFVASAYVVAVRAGYLGYMERQGWHPAGWYSAALLVGATACLAGAITRSKLALAPGVIVLVVLAIAGAASIGLALVPAVTAAGAALALTASPPNRQLSDGAMWPPARRP